MTRREPSILHFWTIFVAVSHVEIFFFPFFSFFCNLKSHASHQWFFKDWKRKKSVWFSKLWIYFHAWRWWLLRMIFLGLWNAPQLHYFNMHADSKVTVKATLHFHSRWGICSHLLATSFCLLKSRMCTAGKERGHIEDSMNWFFLLSALYFHLGKRTSTQCWAEKRRP